MSRPARRTPHLTSLFPSRMRADHAARSGGPSAPADPVAGRVEPLEERALLTVFVVDTVADTQADDGRISLREALAAANSNEKVGEAEAGEETGDRIVFDRSIAGGRIVLDAGLDSLAVTDDVVIAGRGVIVDAGRIDGPAFDINLAGTEQVVLDSLQIRNATNTAGDGFGGGVFFDGSTGNSKLGLRGVRLLNNVAGDGAGLYQLGGTTAIVRSALVNNQATGAAGSGGGALLANGRMTVRESIFQGNTSVRAGGGIEVGGQAAAASLFVSDTDFLGNVTGRGNAAPGNGGAIHTSNARSLAIRDGLIRGNVAANEGGGVWINDGDRLSVAGTEFIANRALGNLAENGGGGLYNNGGIARLEDVTFRSNTAEGAAGSGGGILNTEDGTIIAVGVGFERNTASRAGGGVEIVSGRLSGSQLVFLGNVTGGAGTANPGNGGAIHAATAGGDSLTVSLTETLFLSNRAANEGGAVWVGGSGSTNVRLQDAVFDANRAVDGGGFYLTGGQDAALVDGMFTDNAALRGDGGAALVDSGTLRVSGTLFDGNSASRFGGGIANGVAAGDPTLLVLADASITGNTAGAEGGGVYTAAQSRTIPRNATVTGNTPDNFGGPGRMA